MRAVVAIFIALPFVSALSGVVTKGSEVNNQTFDYIIIGGGLGGFTVAGRLSEDPNVKVLVIEAGRDTRTDEIVSDAYNYGKNFNQEEYPDIWWNWPTENGHGLMGGRGLGGSTSVNGMTFTRGQKAQYDALGELLGGNTNDGKWSWDGMLAAMKKSEHYSAPNEEQRARGAGFNADVHGSLGPVQVTFPNQMYDKQARAFHDVCAGNFSIPHSDDAADGSAAVVSWFPNSIDWQRNDSRSSSVEAYYTPVEKERSNIAVLINHRAVQIVTEGTNDTVKGTAVKLVDSNGGSFTANVGKEVIVSAGAINTPQILQLSGIGDKKHLDSIGINTVIDLPGVGKNLQEQTMSIVGWKANTQETIKSLSNVIAYPDIKAMFSGRVANISDTIKNNIYQYSLDAVASGAIVSQSAAEFLLGNQADLMINKGVGLLELFFDNGGYNINAWNLLPFSRGSINIKSNDYNETMRIDTRTFAAKIDRTIQIEGARMARQIWKSAPLRSLVSEETQPADKVADDENGGSDDDWWNWISENWLSVNHPIGTCSMMLEEHGGVVDGNLRVYHSSNIRIVDASVLPHQLSAHLSATLYGVAENAADIIKAGN